MGSQKTHFGILFAYIIHKSSLLELPMDFFETDGLNITLIRGKRFGCEAKTLVIVWLLHSMHAI